MHRVLERHRRSGHLGEEFINRVYEIHSSIMQRLDPPPFEI